MLLRGSAMAAIRLPRFTDKAGSHVAEQTKGHGMRWNTMAALLLVGTATLSAASDNARQAFRMVSTVLYQPDPVLQTRVPSLHALAAYWKALEGTCNVFFKKSDTPRPLDIVVAVKPQGRSRVWFVSPTQGSKEDAELARLRALLEALPAPEVLHGPVLFAVIGSIAGAERANRSGEASPIPLPPAWKDALKGQDERKAVDTDRLIELVWPEAESR